MKNHAKWRLRCSHAISNCGAVDLEVHGWHDRFSRTMRVGFCLRDDEHMPGYLLGFPIPETQGERPRALRECGWQKQGLSPGRLDIYGYELDGQSLDVSELQDGIYVLRTLVDPGDLLREAEEGNNAAQVYFGIYGERLEVFGIEGPATWSTGAGLPRGTN